MTAVPHPTRIFISFARKDLEHLHALETHLANLKRQKRITVWTDQVLEPGELWEPALREALRDADILLCLVTPDFMASNFIHDVELKESLARAQHGQVRIIPVLVRPTDLQGHALDARKGLPRGFKPVTEWRNRDRAWLEVVTGLRTVLDKPLMPQDVPQPLPGGYEALFEDHPPSALLVARYRVVPFFQALRASELERIHTWLEQERRFDVLLITGDAGTGKTRLLYEVIERRREACWVAGLVDARTLFDAVKVELQEVLAIPHPLLLAVDYAETSPELGRLLAWLQAQSHKRPKPLRVLLAARGAGDWWQNLPFSLNLALSSLLKAPPLAVGAIPAESTPEALTELYRESLHCFAGALGMPTPEPLPVESPEPESLAFESLDRRPLFVMLTALAQTLGLPTKRETLLEALIHHERQFWRSLLPEHAYDQDPVLADTHRLVAAVTLRGGVRSEPELKSLFERLAPVPELTLTRARSFMRRVYPGAGLLWVRPVEPDLLGAELVRQVLVKPGTDALLEPALADNNPEALATAFRLLEDIGQEDQGLSTNAIQCLLQADLKQRSVPAMLAATRWRGHIRRHAIADVLLQQLQRNASQRLLESLMWELPDNSLVLKELSLWVTQSVLREEQTLGLEARAIAWSNLSVRLCNLRRYSEAEEAIETAIRLCDNLMLSGISHAQRYLARSLVNVGLIQQSLGNIKLAYEATRRACERFHNHRQAHDTDAVRREHAHAFSQLNACQNELGMYSDAIKSGLESAKLFRTSIPDEFDAIDLQYVRSQINLANAYLHSGRAQMALEIIQKMEDALSNYNRTHPDVASPDLAHVLTILGGIYTQLGNHEESYRLSVQSVQMYRNLSKLFPHTTNVHFAEALHNLAVDEMNLGRLQDAQSVAEEAISIYRGTFAEVPASRKTLAMALFTLAHILHRRHSVRHAYKASLESVEILETLWRQKTQSVVPEFTRALQLHCQICGDLHMNPARNDTLAKHLRILEYFRNRSDDLRSH